MTKQQEQKIIEIYGRNYQALDIPTYLRNREEKRQQQEELDWEEVDRGDLEGVDKDFETWNWLPNKN
jgi:hypothetical protein